MIKESKNQKYQRKCQKAERAFIGYTLWLYRKKLEWSTKDFNSLYNKFITFSKRINSNETSLLETGSRILKDQQWSLLDKVINNEYNQNRDLIYKVLATNEMQVPVQIVLIGTIAKLTLEDTSFLENLIKNNKGETNE